MDETLPPLPANATESIPRRGTAMAPPNLTSMPTWNVEEDGNGQIDATNPTLKQGDKGDAQLPSLAPGYVLMERIGRGGMGEVWKALQTSLGREIAVKKGTSSRYADSDAEFRREAVVAASLEHPNIVPVHDLGQDWQGTPLLAMKLVRGRPWNALLHDDWPLLSPPDFLARHLRILADVCQALAFAHAKGFVHLDVKPSQVMVGEFGEVLLTDWGLSIYVGDDATERAEGSFGVSPNTKETASFPSGTPALMSPEQTLPDASQVGPWTDVFLLGATLYNVLTGTFPYECPTAREAFDLASRGVIEPPSKRNPQRHVPADLEAVTMKALSPRPRDRHATAAEFLEAVEGYLSGATARRESMERAEEARNLSQSLAYAMERRTEGNFYADFRRIEAQLESSLSLWSGNRDAADQRYANLLSWAQREVAQGDLRWAEVHLDQARPYAPAGNTTLLEEARMKLVRATARKRQQRSLLTGAGLLILAFAIVTVALACRGQAARLEATRAEAKSMEEERLKDLFSALNELRSEEEKLATSISAVLPLPTELDSNLFALFAPEGLDRAKPLLERRAQLRKRRDEIEAGIPEGVPVGSEPYLLTLAEANYQYYTASDDDTKLRALSLYKVAGDLRPDLPEPLVGMGMAAWKLDKREEAMDYLDRAVTLATRTYGKGDERTAHIMAVAGEGWSVYDPVSEKPAAYLGSASEVIVPRWLREGNVIANIYMNSSQYPPALSIARTSLEIGEKFPQLDKVKFQLLTTSASALARSGSFEEAGKQYDEALSFSVNSFGEDSPYTASILKSQGTMYYDMGEFEKAEEALRRSADAFAKNPADITERWGAQSALAGVLYQLGKLQESKDILLSLEKEIGAVSSRDHELRFIHTTLAEIARTEKDEAAFITNIEKAMTLADKTVGGREAKAILINNLAEYYRGCGESSIAIPLFEQSISILKDIYGPDHPQYATALNNLALVYSGTHDAVPAENALRECLRIFEATFGADHYMIGVTYVNLAGAIDQQQGRDEEARALYLAGRDICRKSLTPDSTVLKSIEQVTAQSLKKLDKRAASEDGNRSVPEAPE